MAATEPSAETPSPTRAFGRYQLRQLLGKSSLSMVWLAHDPGTGQDVYIHLPRVQPAEPQALDAWLRNARQAARLKHPHLAPVVDVAVQDHWPYVVTDRAQGQTLVEWLAAHPQPAPADAVALLCQALEGLAYAHEAGVVHQDLQLHHLLVTEQGQVSVAGFDIVVDIAASDTAFGTLHTHDRTMPLDPVHLRARRHAAERDVLAAGVLLHHLLSGQPALDEADTAKVIGRLPPAGREIVRLPWSTPHPIADALRAIANRATDRQARQRYLNARTLLRALTGWREADAEDSGGPMALLLDRLRSVGHLPALPSVAARVARLSRMEGQRTDEMAEQVLQDMALSFELLRLVNTAQVQGTQAAGNGPVLTLRRTIALLGVNGVRNAAAGLRAWPGPLSETGAAALKTLMDRVRLAGHTAQALRPAGYDAEVIYLLAVLQNLGRLMVQYHFPDEAEQIRSLMQSEPPQEPGGRELPGMSEEGASFAVLGVGVEALGAGVARHWGLAEEVLHMIRRLPLTRPVRTADGDADLLRTAASAANEAIDALGQLAGPKVNAALATVAQRYARALGISVKDVNEALQSARSALNSGTHAAALKGEGVAAAMDQPNGLTSLTPALVTTVGAAPFPT